MYRREEDFNDPVGRFAEHYGVPSWVILATIATESSFDPAAGDPGSTDGKGLMQVRIPTARGLGYRGLAPGDPAALTGLYDPEINIDLGTKLLAQLAETHPDIAWDKVYDYYNSGGKAATRDGPNMGRWRRNAEYFKAKVYATLAAHQGIDLNAPAPAPETTEGASPDSRPLPETQATTTDEGPSNGLLIAAAVAVLLWILYRKGTT